MILSAQNTKILHNNNYKLENPAEDYPVFVSVTNCAPSLNVPEYRIPHLGVENALDMKKLHLLSSTQTSFYILDVLLIGTKIDNSYIIYNT